MIKKQLKRVAEAILGPERLRTWRRRSRGGKLVFSEADLIRAYFEARRAPGVMVDVGAHFGESFAPYLAAGWQVYAFEPDSKNRAKLLESTRADAIRLFPIAVSDHEADDVAFFASEESHGISSLSAFRPTHRETERVRLTTLRRVLEEERVERVDFLKIDTEGHDLLVLKGFPWERLLPEVVLAEFEDGKTLALGYDYRAMGDTLVARGYRVFLSEWEPIVRYGVTHTWRSWRSYPCQVHDPKAWGNFVAFRPDCDLDAVHAYVKQFST